jgi:hypothetical protein
MNSLSKKSWSTGLRVCERVFVSEMTFRGLEIWDLGIMTRVGVRKLGEIDGLVLEQVENGLNGHSGISARAGHRRSRDPGLWVCNKEQWADRGRDQTTPSCLCERT